MLRVKAAGDLLIQITQILVTIPFFIYVSRESLVLTNMAQLITKIHEEVRLTGNNSLKSCSPETLYEFFENNLSIHTRRNERILEQTHRRIVEHVPLYCSDTVEQHAEKFGARNLKVHTWY